LPRFLKRWGACLRKGSSISPVSYAPDLGAATHKASSSRLKPANCVTMIDGLVRIKISGLRSRETRPAYTCARGPRAILAPNNARRGRRSRNRTEIYALGLVRYEASRPEACNRSTRWRAAKNLDDGPNVDPPAERWWRRLFCQSHAIVRRRHRNGSESGGYWYAPGTTGARGRLREAW